MKPQTTPDPQAIMLIRPTLKIAGGFVSVCRVGEDLSETEVRKLDVASTPDHEWPGLFELVEEEIDRGHRSFIVDLRKVPWMNSRGLGRLIELWQYIAKAGGKVAMICGPGRILTILEISQVTLIMKPVNTLAEAVQAVNVAD